MLQITQVTSDEHLRKVRELIDELRRWDLEQSQRLGLDPQDIFSFFYSTYDRPLLENHVPPDGAFRLATVAGEAAGCAAFHRIGARACELHRVYVRGRFRGMRIGRLLTQQLISAARICGYESMRLETATFMKEAQALYASLGFRPRDPYRPVPEVLQAITVCMERTLTVADSTNES